MRRALLAIVAVALLVAVGAAQQSRDAVSTPVSGNSALTGTVVSDDQARTPLRRATVTITGGEPSVTRGTVTDDQGRFAFRALPAGRYNLSAVKAAWIRTFYGSTHPGRAPFGLPPLELTPGVTASVVLSVLHGSVVTGTIVDQVGRPADAIVRVMKYKLVNGVKMLTSATSDSGGAETDDRGSYRIFGIPPGQYVVQATAGQQFFGFGAGMIHVAARDDAQLARGAAPGQFADQGSSSSFAPVYFPGTSDVTAATVVTLGPNDERVSTDFALQLVPSAKISGKATTPNGAPAARLTVRVVPHDVPTEADNGFMMGSMNSMARTAPDGGFTFAALPPGTYTLFARGSDGTLDAAAIGRAQQAGRGGLVNGNGPVIMNLWATAEVTVDGHEISNIDLRLQPGLHVKGRVAFDGAAAVPEQTRVRVTLQPASGNDAGADGPSATSAVDASGTFDIGDVVPGRYRVIAQFMANAGGGWTAASAMIVGHDAIDVPVEIGPNDDLSKVVVRFTDRTSEISGALVDAAGKPVTSLYVVAFSADRSLWGFTGRRLKQPVQPDQTGRFRIANLPAGDYFIAVTTDIEPDDMQDAAVLATLAAKASRLTLAEGEKKVQDFRIGGR